MKIIQKYQNKTYIKVTRKKKPSNKTAIFNWVKNYIDKYNKHDHSFETEHNKFITNQYL